MAALDPVINIFTRSVHNNDRPLRKGAASHQINILIKLLSTPGIVRRQRTRRVKIRGACFHCCDTTVTVLASVDATVVLPDCIRARQASVETSDSHQQFRCLLESTATWNQRQIRLLFQGGVDAGLYLSFFQVLSPLHCPLARVAAVWYNGHDFPREIFFVDLHNVLPGYEAMLETPVTMVPSGGATIPN